MTFDDTRPGRPRTHTRSSWTWKALGALSVGALGMLSAATPALAQTPPANVNYPSTTANNLIVGSGGSTDYVMMQALDTLFNQVPGCVITSGSVTGAPSKGSQELNYACETNSGGTTLEQVSGNSFLDNPINDVAVEEPATGSSNGIAQLELDRNQVGTGIGTSFTATNPDNVAAINYARSSRDPSGSQDVSGLNFVAFAKDAIAPLIFTEFGSSKTPFGKLVAGLPGLSTADLQGIYNGSIYDWGQLGSKVSEPIFVYSAQEGSGAQSTFKTFLGFDPSSASNKVNCTDPVTPGTKVVTTPSKTSPTPTFEKSVSGVLEPLTPTASTCSGPDVIFANQTVTLLANATSSTEDAIATAWQAKQAGAASPVGDSVYYYPYGVFTQQCEGLKEKISYIDKSSTEPTPTKAGANCGGAPLPSGDRVSLTPVNGVVANPQTILGQGSAVFPIDRFIYNVYANGSNANLPEATPATLNYVSEVGFLCKPQTIDGTNNDTAANEITDPATGVWYHTEIFNAILANGYIPVTATAGDTFGSVVDGAPGPENASGATHDAYMLLSADNGPGGSQYGATYLDAAPTGQSTNTSIPTATNPMGYCILTSTDANTNS
jgi:hypothetical protein